MLITNFEAEAVWYEPDYLDNRDMDVEDRMSVLLSPMTRNEVKRADESISSIRAGKKAKINFTKRHNEMRDKVLLSRVREIVGLDVAVRDSSGEVTGTSAVDTPEMLLKVADDDLLNDIFEAARDGSKLAEGVRGKSESASDSSSHQEAPSGTGDALDAEAKNTKSKTNGAGSVDVQRSNQVSTSTSSLVYNDAPGVS